MFALLHINHTLESPNDPTIHNKLFTAELSLLIYHTIVLPKYTCQSLAKVYTSYLKGKYYTHVTICPGNLATPLSGITDEQANWLRILFTRWLICGI